MNLSRDDAIRLDATEIAACVRSGEVSPVDVIDAALLQIDRLDPSLNAYTVVLHDEARDVARRLERRVRDGDDLGPLAGVPFCVKDVMWVAGLPAANGLVAQRDFVPDEDSICFQRCRDAGAILVGKTNNPELCLFGVTDSPLWGPARNPWNPLTTAGGSSGGAAASVAGGMTPIAVGSDGGGSIRGPASFCGVFGLKPTFGLVPSEPGFRGWRSLTVTGPLSRTVRDAALLMSVLVGTDSGDDLSYPHPHVDYLAVGESDPSNVDGLRVAWSSDLGFAALDPSVRRIFEVTINRLGKAGWRLEQAHPETSDPTHLWTTIAVCEGFAAFRSVLTDWEETLSPGVAEIIRAGDRSACEYLDALHERALYTRAWERFFHDYDVLLTPMMQVPPFAIGLRSPTEIDGRPVDPFFDDWSNLCYPANLTQQPAASVPIGVDPAGLPVGLQIIAPRYGEIKILRAARALEALPLQGT